MKNIKNLFKKLFIAIIGFAVLSLSSPADAYSPTSGDLVMINQLQAQLNQIISGSNKDTRDFYTQINALKPQLQAYNEDRIYYILDELQKNLYTQFTTAKTKAKIEAKIGFQNFITQYNTGIIENNMADNCTGRYNTIDNISFANNFPTALTIATRFRESHCGYYLPSNGDGPFQILSKDYGTGTITPDIFTKSVQDFIDFSKAKHQQYKTKLGISLTYTGLNLTGIVYHSALYNGATITGNTTSGYAALPNNPKYVYEGYGNYASGTVRYGLLPKFIKTLERELKNVY